MNKNTVALAGKNIYLDMYGDTVYYNAFDKKGYIISPQVEQKFRVIYYRYSIIIIALILLGDYFKTFQNTLLVGVAATVIAELYFRVIFLKKLKSIKDFKRERKLSKLEIIINSKAKEKTMMKLCAYVLLSILIVINAIQQNYNMIFMTLSIIVAIYGIYSAIINGVAFSKMKNK
ncbi:hypothetical protein [Clostridium celatum]|nr:hypothetical protein [Clostridium celatum]